MFARDERTSLFFLGVSDEEKKGFTPLPPGLQQLQLTLLPTRLPPPRSPRSPPAALADQSTMA
jgi:hypothetical protein